MKYTIFLCLLFTSQFANALSSSERDCLTKVAYFEARGESDTDVKKVIDSTVNRKKHFKFHRARSAHVCDIMRAKSQFSFYKPRKTLVIKEKSRYNELTKLVRAEGWKGASKGAEYFTSRNGTLYFRKYKKKR